MYFFLTSYELHIHAKLNFCDVVGYHIKIFSSYLENCKQTVEIESRHPIKTDVQLRVLQGSRYSLSMIMINDIGLNIHVNTVVNL